jgi:hypothetical protein
VCEYWRVGRSSGACSCGGRGRLRLLSGWFELAVVAAEVSVEANAVVAVVEVAVVSWLGDGCRNPVCGCEVVAVVVRRVRWAGCGRGGRGRGRRDRNGRA